MRRVRTVKPDGFGAIGDGLRKFLLTQPGSAADHESAFVFGIEPDRIVAIRNCLIERMLREPTVAAGTMCVGVFRIELDGLSEVADGLGPFLGGFRRIFPRPK